VEGLRGWAAHDLLPGSGAGILAHGPAVQSEVPGHGAVAPAGFGQGVHGLEQPLGVPPGSCVRSGVLGGPNTAGGPLQPLITPAMTTCTGSAGAAPSTATTRSVAAAPPAQHAELDRELTRGAPAGTALRPLRARAGAVVRQAQVVGAEHTEVQRVDAATLVGSY
jgi:hypothetical protein